MVPTKKTAVGSIPSTVSVWRLNAKCINGQLVHLPASEVWLAKVLSGHAGACSYSTAEGLSCRAHLTAADVHPGDDDVVFARLGFYRCEPSIL